MSNYSRGTVEERLARHHLEADGYVVTRSAGSKGFKDLDAIKPGQLLFVQSKGPGFLSEADWSRLVEYAAWIGAIPILSTRDLDIGCRLKHGNDSARCGTVLWQLVGPKVRGAVWSKQPVRRFITDEIDAALAARDESEVA